MQAPDFWKVDSGLSRVLTPIGWIFDVIGSLRRYWQTPVRVDCPVVCIGNFVAGGAGKTPVAMAIAELCHHRGLAPHFLTRGYGGKLPGPVRVVPAVHDAADVGDEALLLAGQAPTWVARDRPAGARAAIEAGADLIIMDDGFQNGSLYKDLSLVVVDAVYGIGNGKVMPAGPLREPMAKGMARADAVIRLSGQTGAKIWSCPNSIPCIDAALAPATDTAALRGQRVVGFAGIGRPQKFFDTLGEIGCKLVATKAFPDHHAYRNSELEELRRLAEMSDAKLVTTEKDMVRIDRDLRSQMTAVPVTVAWADDSGIDALLVRVLPHG